MNNDPRQTVKPQILNESGPPESPWFFIAIFAVTALLLLLAALASAGEPVMLLEVVSP